MCLDSGSAASRRPGMTAEPSPVRPAAQAQLLKRVKNPCSLQAQRECDTAMRPSRLDPLFAALTTLPGVGPKLGKLYQRLFGREDAPARVLDLLFHLPSGTVDRRARPVIRDVVPGSVATISVTVDRHRPPPPNRSRAPYQIYASDDTGDLILTFFHAKRDYLEKLLPVGERRIVSGTTALYDGMLQMVHPDRVVSEAELEKLPLVEPVYPLTEGLTINVGAQGGGRGADQGPATAGMAGRGVARAQRLSGIHRGAARAAPPRRSGRHPARKPGLVAARL